MTTAHPTDVLAQRIRQARLDRGLTQADLGAALGVNSTTVLNMESGAPGLTVLRLCELAVALDLNPADMLPRREDLGSLGVRRTTPKPVVEPLTGDAYVEAVARGGERYHESTGRLPSRTSGDASAWVGFTSTWAAIDQCLRKGHRDTSRWQSLRDFLIERGIG